MLKKVNLMLEKVNFYAEKSKKDASLRKYNAGNCRIDAQIMLFMTFQIDAHLSRKIMLKSGKSVY